jgi:DNA-binding NtrC family response regulator
MNMDQPDGNLHSVLLLDTDVVVRAALAAYLRECGLLVLEASDTSEAKTVLSESGSQVDIILCDAGSIGTEPSFAFTQWVRTHHQDVPVLLAGTIDSAASLAGDLCEEGPQLSKPYDHSLVADAIRQALARKDRNQIT